MNRIESVDVLRIFAITAVIAIHTGPFAGTSQDNATVWNLYLLINQLARFAVPFFFVIAGYFWGAKISGSTSPGAISSLMAKRIILIFAAWSVVYALPYNVSAMVEYGPLAPIKMAYWNLSPLLDHPWKFVMEGTKIHLWFLTSLICALGISHIFIVRRCYKTLIAVSLGLYLIGLLAKAYVDTPFGFHTDFNTRNGPFFSTIFFVSGYFLSRINPDNRWLYLGFAMFALGCVIHFSELYLLWKMYGTPPKQDYLIGTYFMGMGASIAALSNHQILKTRALGEIGKLTLGIYAVHYIFVDLLSPIGKFTSSALWQFAYIFLVLMLSVMAITALSKFKLTRKIVL